MKLLQNLWVERYRPSNLDELCISDENREKIDGFGKQIPNLLLTGNAGGGKTSLARILVNNVLECDYLYINASNENGIDTVRDKILGFAQTKSFDGELKVIILDEVDFFTLNAQAALRNTMEDYTGTTRFILSANYKHKIIPALQSRCQGFEIRPPSIKSALQKCLYILTEEKIKVSTDQKKLLAKLVKANFPDLRKTINEMQKHCQNGQLNLTTKLSTSAICEMIYTNIVDKDSLNTRKYLIEHEEVFNSDWEQLLRDLLNFVYDQTLDDFIKKSMILTIADHLEKSTRVNDQEINLFACLLNLENVQ